MPQGRLTDQESREGGTGIHVVVGEHADGFELGVVQQVRLVEDQDRGPAAFGVFGGQRGGGLRDEGCGVEAGCLSERGDDVVQHAADPDRRVGQVDHHVSRGIQGGGRGADGDGFAGADLTGDHAEGVLVDAPADPGDGFGVPVVAVQHRRGEAAAERHPGETPVRLQTLDAHSPASRVCSPAGTSSLRASSMLSCPGSCSPSGAEGCPVE